MFVKWKDIYKIGNEEIDNQHMLLFDIMNDLHDAQKSGTAQTMVESTLKRLLDYTSYHFSTEESLMQESSYPNYSIHLNEHMEFLSKLFFCEHNSKNGNLIVSLKILDLLKEWIMTHILGSDQEFGDFLKQNKKAECNCSNLILKNSNN